MASPGCHEISPKTKTADAIGSNARGTLCVLEQLNVVLAAQQLAQKKVGTKSRKNRKHLLTFGGA